MKCITQRLRAIDDSEKALKRQSILDATAHLLAADSDNLPAVMTIARAAGLAKGTVYLYFKTKEEIFLALLAEQYDTLLTQILQLLDSDTSNDRVIDALINVLSTFMNNQPTFMPLASMANSVIEKNVDRNIVAEFKLMLINHLETVGVSLNLRFPTLSKERGAQLLLHTNAMIIGLWQMQIWPKNIRDLINQPKFKLVAPEFFPEMMSALSSLWLGSLASTQPQK